MNMQLIFNNFIDQYQRVAGPRMLLSDEKNEQEILSNNKHIQAIS